MDRMPRADEGCWTPLRLIAALESRGAAPAVLAMQGDDAMPVAAAQIAADARRLAGGLIAAGMAPGEAVALHAPNSPDWIVVRLAIAATGALPMAIDDLTDTAAAEAIIAGAGCRWVFASAAHAAELAAPEGLRVVLVDRPEDDAGWHAL
ncbi:AMP-binding protein, partial [Roseomonas rosulenta]|uniref:AMP-binding protein n=1 Tax=Roseomonas rosulenta TaxID=2748667 RepID=UPI0018DF36C4